MTGEREQVTGERGQVTGERGQVTGEMSHITQILLFYAFDNFLGFFLAWLSESVIPVCRILYGCIVHNCFMTITYRI